MKKTLTTSLVVLTIIVIGTSMPVAAQEAADLPSLPAEDAAAEETIARAACVEPMIGVIEEEEQAFMEFIDNHFQNELENSVLFEQAMKRYRQVRGTLHSELNEFSVSGATLAETIAGQELCQTLINESVDRMQFVLKQHALKTAQNKTALKITDKYKALNKKIRDLNFEMATLKGNFYSFNNLLPSFTETCGK